MVFSLYKGLPRLGTPGKRPHWSTEGKRPLNSALPLKDSDTAWDSNYSHSGWETVSCSRWHQYPRKKTTGARDCLPPRVQAKVQSMASNGNGCRDLRPLICSRCKGVLKQDNEWKGQQSTLVLGYYRVLLRRNLEAIGAVGANLWQLSFSGSVEPLRWSAQPR